MGVIVGVAVIVTMVSFGLGLQGNMLARFKALDFFNEIQVFGQGLSNLAGLDRPARRDEGERGNARQRANRTPTRILDDAGIKEISAIPGVAYVEPNVNFGAYVRSNGKLVTQNVGGANIPNAATRFQHFAAGKMISSPTADEAVVSERFVREFGYAKPADAVGKTLELLAPPDEKDDAEEETPNFFGIPLDDPGLDESSAG
ncbi:MAG TPA: ABC transporter permease, partial [Pyrinomonadaceae bacterium]|nr:ABC transporter permease [Pyrinomonadaceae bacterium]